MQGQSSTFKSFPQNYYCDHGSSVNNLGLVPRNVVPENAVHGDDQTTLGQIGQSNPSAITQNSVSYQELTARRGWLSFLHDHIEDEQMLEERPSELNNDHFSGSVNVSLNNGPVTNGPSTLHGANSSVILENLDLNAKYEDNEEVMGVGLCLCPSKLGPAADQVPPASSSSIPPVVSPGTAGNVVEENDNRSGLPLDGRCLSCKRKSPENAFGELPLDGSSSSIAVNSGLKAVPAQDNTSNNLNISTSLNNSLNVSHPEHLNPGLGVGMIGADSGMLQSTSTTGNAERFQRNIRLRTENEQVAPASILSAGTPITNSHAQPPIQPSVLSNGTSTTTSNVQSPSQPSAFSNGTPGRNSQVQLPSQPAVSPTGTPIMNSHVQSLRQPSVSSAGTPVMNSHVQAANQTPVLFPFNRSSDSRSAAAAFNTIPQVPPLVHFPNSSQTLQPSPWNWVTRSRPSGVPSVSPVVSVHEGDALQQGESSRNTPTIPVSQTERGSLPQNPTNLSFASFAGENANIFRNIASASRNAFGSGFHQFPSPNWFPQRNTAGQHEQGSSEIARSSMTIAAGSDPGMLSYRPPHPDASANGWQNSYRPPYPGASVTGWQNSYRPPHPGTSVPGLQNIYYQLLPAPNPTGGHSYRPPHPGAFAPMPEMAFARAGNARPSVPHIRPVFVPSAMIQADSHPYALRSMTADQRRSRLVSEVRQGLGLVHRNGTLQFEDVMIIDHSVLYGVPEWNVVDEEPDMLEDMRLDVDDMSYEELLDLEEQIGNVCTGLNEEAIIAHLKWRKYQSIRIGLPVEDEPCCICQIYLNIPKSVGPYLGFGVVNRMCCHGLAREGLGKNFRLAHYIPGSVAFKKI
ncbi:hypothetical protein L1049_023292 [Liquidambar formosana]|uniref:RING-type E3 ubiquitin transferase n=1 Tax=Liquidambar formosana TaxID=63359 RepID=A0AAP0X407_LIQFO